MPFTTWSLSGDVANLVDGDYDPNSLRVTLEASQPMVSDGATRVRVGDVAATITAGAFTFTGIPATVSGAPLYRVLITWTDGASRKPRHTATGWFAMTANSDLAVKVTETVTPTVIDATVAADIKAAAALGATNDTATASYVNNPASATSGALKATYVKVTEAPLNASRYASLQAAADAIPAAGGDIYIPPGAYAGNVAFKPKTKVEGGGRTATQINGTVTINGADSNTLTDVTITPQTTAAHGLVLNGAFRSSFDRINIVNSIAGYGGTGLLVTGTAATPAFYCSFDDINMIHNSGGGRLVWLSAPAAGDWITALNFRNLTGRGVTGAKLTQGVRADGSGVVQHVKFEDAYIEYSTFEGWYLGPNATFNTLINVTTEAAGTAYAIDGNYLTALEAKHFGSTIGWSLGATSGHRIIGSQMTRIDGTTTLGGAADSLGFYGKAPVVRPSGTPAAAVDAATTQALANDLRAKLLALGLIA